MVYLRLLENRQVEISDDELKKAAKELNVNKESRLKKNWDLQEAYGLTSILYLS